MKRFIRASDEDIARTDESADDEQWVLGRKLSRDAVPAPTAPRHPDVPDYGGARLAFAAVGAACSAVALVCIGLLLLSERFAAASWPLVVALVALAGAAVCLAVWWRRSAGDPGIRRTYPR